MAENFYTILTNTGKAKIANATALGTKVNFTILKVGDSNGTYYNPAETQENLVHEVWQGNINSITTDAENPNWIVVEVVIPSNVGGFVIREVGIFDDEGDMLAIGKYPETYKPQVADGSTKDITIKMILEVSNSASVTLKVDPTVTLATKTDFYNLAGTGRTTETVKGNADAITTLNNTVNAHKAENTQQFNDLKQYSTLKLNKDTNGKFTEIQLKRKDGTLIIKSVLTGGVSPNYTTRTETEYDTDGVTIKATRVYAISYDSDGKVTSEVLQ